MFDTFVFKVDLHDIHKVGHLCEDKDSVVEFFEFWEDAIDELEFARWSEYPVMEAYVIVISEEHIGVIAAFT